METYVAEISSLGQRRESLAFSAQAAWAVVFVRIF